MFKGTMTKWPVQKLTQGTTQKLLKIKMVFDVKLHYVIVFNSQPLHLWDMEWSKMCNKKYKYLKTTMLDNENLS